MKIILDTQNILNSYCASVLINIIKCFEVLDLLGLV